MRGVPVLVVLALLLVPSAGALAADALPVLPAESSRAATSAGEDGVDGPHLRVHVVNEGDARDARLTAYEAETWEPVAARDVHTPAREETVVTLPIPEGDYFVTLGETEDHGVIGRGGSWVGTTAYTDGCPGAFVTGFVLEADGGTSTGYDAHGCLVPPRGFHPLLEEARAAAGVRARDRGVHVPIPGDADAGEYLLWGWLTEPDWEEAAWLRFQWQGERAFQDAWGRTVEGPELTYTRSDAGYARMNSDGVLGLTDPSMSLDSTQVPSTVRYARGDTAPLAHSGMMGFGVSMSGLGLVTSWLPTRSDAYHVQHLRYEARGALPECAFRFPAQGTTVTEGARLPAHALCDGDATRGMESRWVVGAVTEHRGFTAVPVYLVHETDGGLGNGGRTIVTRAWLADGVPYPLSVDAFAAGDTCCSTHVAVRLERLAGDGAPLATTRDPLPPGNAPAHPVDPLEGPALTAHRDRVPFPLDEAVHAARADPMLTRVARVLADADAALAGAVMRVREDAGAHAPEAHVWHMLFTSPRTGVAHVACERPVARAGDATVPVPAVTCEARDEAPAWAWALNTAPVVAAADVPRAGASFDDAIARWDVAREDGRADARVTHLEYRAWSDDAPWAHPASVVAGTHFPLQGQVAMDADHDALFTRVDLVTGRTLADSHGVREAKGAHVLPDGIDPASRESGMDRGAGVIASAGWPVVAGAGVAAAGALGALALFWGSIKAFFAGLYTRLTRPQVLDQDVRARIRELVDAEPGIHASGVRHALGSANGLTEYHLGVLVREGVLACVETPGFRRYFIKGRYSPTEMRALAALRGGQAEKVYRLIRAHPGINMSALAAEAGLSLPGASKTVRQLVDAGLVDRVREGRAVTLYALDA